MNIPPHPPFAPFPPVPVPPPPGRHPGLYADADGYTRKEVDDRDADTLSAAKKYADGKYELPSSGIPATDLSSGVQASLAKADTALQEHQSLSGYATEEWVGEQGFLTEHQSLSGYVQKSETSGLLKNDGSVDTNTYLTEHQSLSGYVQKSVIFDNPDTNPMIKSALLPSYVDDVLEYASTSGFPSSGETGKIYVALDTNKTYRWGGSEYVQVGGGELPALATVATTGDYDDLLNKPTIPAAQVNADWNASSGVAQILNKPTIPSTDGPFTAREEAVASQTREQTSYGKGGAATSDGEGNTWSTALPKNNGTLALQEGLAPAYSSSSTYTVGDYVTHQGLLYKCSTAVATAGAWNAANWTAVAVTDEMGGSSDPTKANSTAVAPAFDSTKTYNLGDHVMYSGNLYKCTTPVSTAGDWTGAANWTSTSVFRNKEYVEVEYIEVGNNRMIDTGVPCSDNATNFSHTIQIPNWSYAYWESGAWDSNQNVFLSFLKGSGYDLWVFAFSSGHVSVGANDFVSGFSELKVWGDTVYVNGNSVSTFTRNANGFNINYCIGGRYGSTGNANVPTIRIAATKIWTSAGLVRDFRPVKVGGVGYLFDAVSGELFGNVISGTTITCGPEKGETLPLMDGMAAHGSSEEMAPIDHVHPTDTSRAPLASPAFTGTPTAPTAAVGTNTTQVATTAFVQSAIAALRSELGLT